MYRAASQLILRLLSGCSIAQTGNSSSRITIGESSFALAARYGTPTGYQLQGDYMQLDYGFDAAGCRLIVLIDQAQRVVGWASTGKNCATPQHQK